MPAPTPTTRRSALMVPILLVPTFMGFLDLWIVLVALPSIRADLHASLGAAQLVVGIYLTTYGAALVLGGRLGDRFGRRRMLSIGVAAFTASSALCALAPDPASLVVARALEGLGAALMLPQVLSIIQVAVPAPRRAAAIGAYTSVIGLAVVSGLVLGGTLLQVDLLGLGWRALFAINVPIGIAVLAAIPAVIEESTAPERHQIDLAGAALLGGALVAGLLSLVEGSDRSWPPWTIAGLVLGAALGGWFARTELGLERRGGAPLVPGRLLRERPVRFGLAMTLVFYVANSGLFVVLPFLFQGALGLGPFDSGIAFAPLGALFVVSSLASRRSSAATGTAPILVGTLLMATGLVGGILATRAGGGAVAISAPVGLYGLGSGMVYPRIVGTVLAHVPTADAGAASGVLLTATQIANALGVAIVGSTFSAAAGLGARDAFAVAALVVLGCTVILGAVAGASARSERVWRAAAAAGSPSG